MLLRRASATVSTSLRASNARQAFALVAPQVVLRQEATPRLPQSVMVFQISKRPFGSDVKSETFLPINEVSERVLNVVKNFEKVDPSKVKGNSHFVNDLGLDSLDTVELVMAFEEEFVLTIPDDISEKILTCEDAIRFISQHPQAR